jgi:hypothetical protein
MSNVNTYLTYPFRGHGSFIINISGFDGKIDRHSKLVASITEISAPAGEPLDYPFHGGAGMHIRNVVPYDNGTVDFWVQVDWDNDLNLRMTIYESND